MSHGENLPERGYFLNNGRSDTTREELKELLIVIAKTSCISPQHKGSDGASFPELEFDSELKSLDTRGEPHPFPGFGEGASLEDQGLESTVMEVRAEPPVQIMPSQEGLEVRPCEGRYRRQAQSAEGLAGYFDDESYDDESDEPEFPSDHGHL